MPSSATSGSCVRVKWTHSSTLSVGSVGCSGALASLPPELKITPLFDQSLFVSAAIQGVLREAIIAACLTAAMILLFLGDWRSTVIIAISIPLAIVLLKACAM